MTFTDYVLGFAFDDLLKRVILIKKTHGPEALIGKFNGVGGKAHPGENNRHAMIREFLEETGVNVKLWKLHKVMNFDTNYQIRVYYTTLDDEQFNSARTTTDEEVVPVWIQSRVFREGMNALMSIVLNEPVAESHPDKPSLDEIPLAPDVAKLIEEIRLILVAEVLDDRD